MKLVQGLLNAPQQWSIRELYELLPTPKLQVAPGWIQYRFYHRQFNICAMAIHNRNVLSWFRTISGFAHIPAEQITCDWEGDKIGKRVPPELASAAAVCEIREYLKFPNTRLQRTLYYL